MTAGTAMTTSINTQSFPLGGYIGKVLYVDLSAGRTEVKPLDKDDALKYIGGRGLAMRLFYDSVDPATDALGPGNAVALATSPLTGTNTPTGGRGHIVFKSPLTGVVGSSNSGGDFAVAFKKTGFDALVIKGSSPAPVYLSIAQEGTGEAEVELRDASSLWGKDVHRTTDALLAPTRGSGGRVLCIGPAGEWMWLPLSRREQSGGEGKPRMSDMQGVR